MSVARNALVAVEPIGSGRVPTHPEVAAASPLSASVVVRAARTLHAEPAIGTSFWTLARAGRIHDTEASHHDSNSNRQHELLELVQRLFLPVGTSRDGLRSVVFASPEGSHAADLTGVSVAETLAQHTRRSVCVVDANLRDPFLHHRFALGNRLGLADVLLDARMLDAAVAQVESTVWVLPAGQRVPGQSLASSAHADAVAALHDAFDIVVMCACARSVEAETTALAHAADGVVLVIDPKTRRDVARRSVTALQTADCRVSGVVLHTSPRGSLLARLLQ